jgi:hypothetical protein
MILTRDLIPFPNPQRNRYATSEAGLVSGKFLKFAENPRVNAMNPSWGE